MSENVIDPGEVFCDICVDVGFVWGNKVVVTVAPPVERHNSYRLSVAHQRTTRITLWGENVPLLWFVAFLYREPVDLLFERAYPAESIVGVISTGTDDFFRKMNSAPFVRTDFLVNDGHIHLSQLMNNLTISVSLTPSSHKALLIFS